MKRIFFLIFITGLVLAFPFPLYLFAQTSANQTDNQSVSPLWIKMIDDPNVNYYDVLKVYDEYWKDHVKPIGEEEEMIEGKEGFKEHEREVKKEANEDRNRDFTNEEIKAKNENDLMKYHVKRFEQWMREVKPFVQENGHILSDKERMEIWEKQQEELKRQQK